MRALQGDHQPVGGRSQSVQLCADAVQRVAGRQRLSAQGVHQRHDAGRQADSAQSDQRASISPPTRRNNASSATTFYEAYQWFLGGTVYLGNKTNGQARPVHAFTDSAQDHLRVARPRLRPQPHHLSRQRLPGRTITTRRWPCCSGSSRTCTRMSIPVAENVKSTDCGQLDRRGRGLLLQRRRPRQCDGRRAEHHDAYDRGDRRLERRQLSELHPLDRQAGRGPVSTGAEQRPDHPGDVPRS